MENDLKMLKVDIYRGVALICVVFLRSGSEFLGHLNFALKKSNGMNLRK